MPADGIVQPLFAKLWPATLAAESRPATVPAKTIAFVLYFTF